MTAPGRFLTIEGGEGTGKSTLIAGLAARLRDRGLDVTTTREPGGTPLAEAVRSLVLNPPEGDAWSPIGEALLMNAARSDHIEKKIVPALRRGDWVICDRFADSTLVYQGIGGVSDVVLRAMQSEVMSSAQPTLTFILDAPVNEMLERRSARGTSDIFESRSLEFHEQVRAGFLRIAGEEPHRCVVLDARQAPEDLLGEALDVIEQRLAPA